MSEPERLVLTEAQSEHLRAVGIRFAVVHPGSYPENVGRFVLDLIPCDYQRAADSVAVAMGTKRAAKPKAKPTP
jgi:hypothetical protein